MEDFVEEIGSSSIDETRTFAGGFDEGSGLRFEAEDVKVGGFGACRGRRWGDFKESSTESHYNNIQQEIKFIDNKNYTLSTILHLPLSKSSSTPLINTLTLT